MRIFIVLFISILAAVANAKESGSKRDTKAQTNTTAAKRAVTDEGSVVILNGDGTWVYESEVKVAQEQIKENSTHFTKPAEATFLVKSTKNNSAFWINPTKWSFQKSNGESQKEYQFQLKNGDLYGAIISEQIEIGIENLGQIALINARKLAPDMQITQQEYRIVNGVKVLYVQMSGSATGIKFTFNGYYYSNKTGTTQYITWTAASMIEKYQSEIDSFLNGFTTQE